jgi:hypothetical protein
MNETQAKSNVNKQIVFMLEKWSCGAQQRREDR